jgi:putative oxygen-independent coproporphyrinogen III oxidase
MSPMFGVYLHFPFCRRRCPYCDFAISIWRDVPHEAYANAIIQELHAREAEYIGRSAVSISFGGGTPSMWRPDCIKRVISTLQQRCGDAKEISLEANPEDLQEDTLPALHDAGINRLSLGVQSFDAQSLLRLGRGHTPAEAREVVARAVKIFPVVSLDLICGAPLSTRETFVQDLELAVSLGVQHLSVYGLTIESKTRYARLDKQQQLHAADDDEIADRLHLAQSLLQAQGFTQYEVSNYARPGYQSVHNSLYWLGGEYLGLGCGAHSFFWQGERAARRAVAVAGASEYLRRSQARESTLRVEEFVGAEDLVCEMILSQARHERGLSLSWFQEKLGVDLVARGGKALERLQQDGKVTLSGDFLRVTSKGIFFVDDITLALLS